MQKPYRVVGILPPGVTKSYSPKEIFQLSDMLSAQIAALSHNAAEKGDLHSIELIQNLKRQEITTHIECGTATTIKNYFYLDGSIKLNGKDIAALSAPSFYNGVSEPSKMLEILKDLTFKKSGSQIFRGQQYYNIFKSVELNPVERTDSINSYSIKKIDVFRFIDELINHYHLVESGLSLMKKVLRADYLETIKKNRVELCTKILKLISPEHISDQRRKINSGDFSLGHSRTDNFFESQQHYALDELEVLREITNDYKVTGGDSELAELERFISSNGNLIKFCDISFGTQLDATLSNSLAISPSETATKVILGIIDAKINILAFIQNLAQIVYNDNFLDPLFPGSLVFRRDIVNSLNNRCAPEFHTFKQSQTRLRSNENNFNLYASLEEQVGLYLEILLQDNNISYLRLSTSEWVDRYVDATGNRLTVPIEIAEPVTLLRDLYNLIRKYEITYEHDLDKKEVKKRKLGKAFIRSTKHLEVRATADKKLIRLYREENDPIVMIKTAQNAINLLLKKDYNPKNDILHIMSVNYGGSLTGLFAKHTILRSLKNRQLVINAGSMVYSIYDVKNANDFSSLADYPYSEILIDETIDDETRSKLESENWLLIFDDNANSGETLDNLRNMALDCKFYGRVNVFPCRSNPNLNHYKSTLTAAQKIEMIGAAAVPSRKLRTTHNSTRYKELIGTLVGVNLARRIGRS